MTDEERMFRAVYDKTYKRPSLRKPDNEMANDRALYSYEPDKYIDMTVDDNLKKEMTWIVDRTRAELYHAMKRATRQIGDEIRSK